MAIFEPIELDWKGVTYRLRGDGDIMRALAAVEDHITIGELIDGQQNGRIPLAKISAAYTAMLRQAGCRSVTEAEVYAGMWEKGASVSAIQEAVSTLMQTMMPPSAMQDDPDEGGEDGESGKAEAPKKGAPKKTASSKQRGKRG